MENFSELYQKLKSKIDTYDDIVSWWDILAKPAFKQFDKDGSGSIDKSQLGELSKQLGNELSDAELGTALKDLDLNGDGVIDIHEFSRWYFSGMKSYDTSKRTMLQFHGHATKLLQIA